MLVLFSYTRLVNLNKRLFVTKINLLSSYKLVSAEPSGELYTMESLQDFLGSEKV